MRACELLVAGRVRYASVQPGNRTACVRWAGGVDGAAGAAPRANGKRARGDSMVVASLDLGTGRVRWAMLTNAAHEDPLDAGHVLLAGRDSAVVLDLGSGECSRAVPAGALVFAGDGIRVRVRDDTYIRNNKSSLTEEVDREVLPAPARRENAPDPATRHPARANQSLIAYDLGSGASRWRRPFANAGFVDVSPPPASSGAPLLVVTGIALESIDPATGEGWCVTRASSEKEKGLGTVQPLGVTPPGFGLPGMAGGGPQGWGLQGWKEPATVHHLGAAPQVRDGRVYWVAGREVLACDAATGAVNWSLKLSGDAALQYLSLHGPRLDVINTGTRIVDETLERAGESGLARLDAVTGTVLAEWTAPENQPVLACATGETTLVLTGRSLFRLDTELRVAARHDVAKGAEIVSFADVNGWVVARTRDGIEGLAPDSLARSWRMALDLPTVDRLVRRGLSLDWRRMGLEEAFRGGDATASLAGVTFRTQDSWKPAALGAFLGGALPTLADPARGVAWVPTRTGFLCVRADDGRLLVTIPYADASETTLSADRSMVALQGGRAVLVWPE